MNCIRALVASWLAAACLAGCGPSTVTRPDSWSAPEALMPRAAFAGVHGLAVDAQGRLLAASVIGSNITQVDRATGATQVFIPAPLGQADDIAIGPNGEMAWTSLLQGVIRYRASDTAPIRALAQGLAGINSLAFDSRNGKLYASQTYSTDMLWEIDVQGVQSPRLVAQALGGLNAFEVGPDGFIYGPLVHKGQVARIDPASGAVTVINSGFKSPTGANLDGKGNLWVVDIFTGELSRVALASGEKTVMKQLRPGVDNMAIAPDGTIYVSNLADNSVHAYNPVTGELKLLVGSKLSVPGALKIDGHDLFVADLFALRRIDVRTANVTDLFIQDASDLSFPFALALGQGRIATVSWFTGKLQLVDRASNRITATVEAPGAPMDVVQLADGSLAIADFAAGTVVRLAGVDFTQRSVIAQGLDGPVQMIQGSDGALYITESAGRLTRIDLSGVRREIAAQLSQPEGLAQTPWGSFIVAEAGARRLVEIAPDGGRRVLAEELPIGMPASQGLPGPYVISGVAVAADGTIYYSADRDGHGAIYRMWPQR